MLSRFKHPTGRVFVTAHDQHAVDAFELQRRRLRAQAGARGAPRRGRTTGAGRRPHRAHRGAGAGRARRGDALRPISRDPLRRGRGRLRPAAHRRRAATSCGRRSTQLEQEWADAGFLRIHRSLLIATGATSTRCTWRAGGARCVVGGDSSGEPAAHPRAARPAGPQRPARRREDVSQQRRPDPRPPARPGDQPVDRAPAVAAAPTATSEIDAQSEVGEIYMRTLLRAQLRLALSILVALGVTIGMLPLLFTLVPGLDLDARARDAASPGGCSRSAATRCWCSWPGATCVWPSATSEPSPGSSERRREPRARLRRGAAVTWPRWPSAPGGCVSAGPPRTSSSPPARCGPG